MPSDKLPELSKFPYAGWVPTANGRLSFRHIGEASHPTPSIYANIASLSRRYILAFQRRNLSDSAFRSITDFVCGVSGDFWFALAAISTEAPEKLEAAISGKLFIFKSKADWRTGPALPVRKAIEELNENRLSLDGQRDHKSEQEYRAAETSLERHADISLRFEMRRAGEVFVSDPMFQDDELAYASKNLASESGHDFNKWIADQSYFFLRDLSHRHQHHSPHVDTLLTLQKRDPEDVAWRRGILFSLHYYIISARRTRYPPRLIQALGVLAYCKSFFGICQKEGYDANQLPEFEVEAIEASLQARIQEDAYLVAANERLGFKIWNARLAFIAVIAPVVALIGVFVQPRIGTPEGVIRFPKLNLISDFLSDHFPGILGLIVLLFVIVWSWATLLPSLAKAPSGRDVLRIGLVNHIRAAAISAFVGLLALIFGVYFGRDAMRELLEPLNLMIRGLLNYYL